jgi:hypothetical protein
MAEFPIKIRADLEGQGIPDTAKGLQDVGKKAEEASKKQVEGAHHAELSHRELRETVGAVGREFGGLADVGLWLNPMTAALAAVLWAVGNLTEQHKKLVESFAESIKQSEEMHKAFRDGIAEGARIAADKIADLDAAHRHLADSTDTATDSMQRELEISQIIARSISDQTSVYESLAEAKIRLAQSQGQMTGTDADDRIQSLKRDAERQKESEEEWAKLEEAKAKRQRAADAATESAAATSNLHAMQPGLATSDAAIITQEARVKTMEEAATKARDAATTADATYAAHQNNVNYLAKEKADKAANSAEESATGAVEHLAALKEENKELNRQADALGHLSEERDSLARKLKEEADQITAEIAARKTAFAATQAVQDQVDQVTHQTREQNRWHQLVNKRNLNPDEQDELNDLTARRNESQDAHQNQPQETRSLVSAANAALNRAMRGQGSQDEIHAVLQRIIGHQDAHLRETEQTSQIVQQLQWKLNDQENKLKDIARWHGHQPSGT